MNEREEGSSVSLVSRVSKIEGQVSALTETVNNFVNASETWRRDFAAEVRGIASSVTDRTQPNTSLMFAVIVGICAFFFTREMGRSHEDFMGLDSKLQREFALMIENTQQKYAEIDSKSKERHESVKEDINDLTSWQRDRDREDRQELMMYRTQHLNQSNATKPLPYIAKP